MTVSLTRSRAESIRHILRALGTRRRMAREFRSLGPPEPVPLPRLEGRPRVLYFIESYPTFSETYMHEEIRSLCGQFNIKIITLAKTLQPRRRPFEFQAIRYPKIGMRKSLVYGRIENINQDLDGWWQRRFLRRVDAVVESFKPQVMHAHYLGLGLLLRQLAERHGVPFTIRTHSMDTLGEPDDKLEALCRAVNCRWCARLLAFPASRERLVERGLAADKAVSCWPVINFERFHKPEPRPPGGRVICAGPAIAKKAHRDFIDLAAIMRGQSSLAFDLYAAGPVLEATRAYNRRAGGVVNITYADPDDMSEVYPRYDWLVYPSHTGLNKVGLPVAIAEAQASGLGVCWQELPGRRSEQLDYLGGGGYLFKSVDELATILSQPYPEVMRRRGFEAARRCDIEQHKGLCSEVWESLAEPRQLRPKGAEG